MYSHNNHILGIYRLYLGYHGDWCWFWENDHILGNYRLYLGYPGKLCWLSENEHILGIYRFYLGYPGNWYWFGGNDNVLGIYKLYLRYPGTFNLCKFLMWGGRARKSNEYTFWQPSETQRTSKTYKTSKAYKTSNIQIDQYPAAGSLCGFTTFFRLMTPPLQASTFNFKHFICRIWEH